LLVPVTSRNRTYASVLDTELWQRLLPSLQATCNQADIRLYLGYDSGDPFYERREVQQSINAQIIETVGTRGSPCWVWNALARRAYEEGASYFYQLGDDVRLLTEGWIEAFTSQIDREPECVTGPIDVNNPRSISSALLTNVFVGRAHVAQWEGIYPPAFKNWYSDDWVSRIAVNRQKLEHWVENLHQPPRYTADSQAQQIFKEHLPSRLKPVSEPAPRFDAKRTLISIAAWNRPEVTRLCAECLWQNRGLCTVEIWDDHSDQYEAHFLRDFCHQVRRAPRKLGIDSLRFLAMRDFLERDEFDFLYFTDNDALHDPSFVERLAKLYESSPLPISLYNSPIHNDANLTLGRKAEGYLRRIAPGISMLLTRPMVKKICRGLADLLQLPATTWDTLSCQLLGLPWLISQPSFVEHLGAGGLHNLDFECDRAIEPTALLQDLRRSALMRLPQPLPRLRVISFSLWGQDPKYLAGALANVTLAAQHFPGWRCRFYHDDSVPADILRQLEQLGADLVEQPRGQDWDGLFWRFLAATDPQVEVMLSRDCDSRLSKRESAAVSEWLESGADFHIMRDHPWHQTAIPGGMWGCRSNLFGHIAPLIMQPRPPAQYQSDQEFLSQIVYPKIRHSAFIHDEFFEGRPFPTRREEWEFVGQVYDENGVKVAEQMQALATALSHGSG